MICAYGLMRDLKKLVWVLMHHPDYWQCYVKSPILFKNYFDLWEEGIKWDLTLGLVIPSIYFPYKVTADYLAANRVKTDCECEDDDIPF